MNYRQIILDIPEWAYKEIDKLSKNKVESYLVDLIKKTTAKRQKPSIAKLFDLFSSKESFSIDHDKHLYK
ncbi:hypothetical protein HZB07_00030 [Candidatus Saganbacteria bacterium]|nr:hypothetical protein [Candidatus Saganbacteria bacterium]